MCLVQLCRLTSLANYISGGLHIQQKYAIFPHSDLLLWCISFPLLCIGNIVAKCILFLNSVVQGESKEENGGAAKVEASLSPSSESSGRSFPSEGIAEGNGDSCSVVSNDGSSNQERNSATISPLPSHTSQDQATSWPGLVEVSPIRMNSRCTCKVGGDAYATEIVVQ